MGFFKEDLAKVKAFVFDVDGVLSLAEVGIESDGNLQRTANTKDGFALQFAIKQGYPIAIITGGDSLAVLKRYEGLGVKSIYLASKDKVKDLNHFLTANQLEAKDILYMGDDLPDLAVMQQVGMPTCPADAVAQIKEHSAYISEYKGGKGCVRDVIEQALRSQNKWLYTEMEELKSI